MKLVDYCHNSKVPLIPYMAEAFNTSIWPKLILLSTALIFNTSVMSEQNSDEPTIINNDLEKSRSSQKKSSVEQNLQGTPITITGVEDAVLQNIAAHLEISDNKVPLSVLGFPRSNEYILRKTRQALQALGYYEPELSLSGDHQSWTLNIDPGNKLSWKQISIKITPEDQVSTELKQLLNQSSIKTGATVNHGEYQNLKRNLASTANQSGFLDAEFITSKLIVLPNFTGANIEWELQLGERYKVKDVQFTDSDLSPEVLQKYLRVHEGDYYSTNALVKTQQQLNRSEYFSSVNVEQTIDHSKKEVSIVIDTRLKEKYQFKSTLGYGTDSGGKIGVEWQDRLVNDAGHRYTISADASKIDRGVDFIYHIPLSTVGSFWLNRASYRIEDEKIATSKISTLESRWIIKQNDFWFHQFSLVLATEEVSKNESIENYLEYLVPSWQVDYYSTEEPFSAEKGFHWQSILRLSNETISDPDLPFIQWEQKLKWVHAFNDEWRFLSRTNIGFTDMDEELFISNMPTNYRFFAGGDTSVRGYRYQSLAPLDSNGELIGGQYLLTQTAEVDWQFAKSWRWAWFVDAGDAFNESSNKKLKRSVGTGVRWVTPVGSIRVDLAKALDLKKEWRWHITIGPDL
ncbi:MAG: BamA/TamA family outer membrane protein [Gammaproteobacteria bacterium]|nr:BamA/TamA family outer membrane protein [Gammaproteobacteria bacterium]